MVDHLGRPLAGAMVVLSGGAAGPVVRTGEDGSFALPSMPPGRYVLFAIHADPAAASEPVVIDGGSFPAPLRLVVEASGTLL